jgi:hypothetical protein
MKLTTCLYLVLKLKMSEATPLLPTSYLHNVYSGNPTLLVVFRRFKQTFRFFRGGKLLKLCFFICNRTGEHD